MHGDLIADRTKSISESETLALNAKVKQLASEGKTIFNLTAGELATDTPEYIESYVAERLSRNKYTPAAGNQELRQKIAEHARSFYGLGWIEPSNVLVTAGAKAGLFLSFLTLIDPGDEVILPRPYWVSYKQMIELVGGKVIEVPLRANFDLDPVAIASKLSSSTKAVIINSPNNPTGAVYSKDSLGQLAAKIKGYNTFVISDDIYSKLVYVDSYSLPAKAGFDNILIINGFSKSQALTGWRIGYVIGDELLIWKMTSVMSHVLGNAASPSQDAAIAALDKNDQPPELTLNNLNEQRELVADLLSKIDGLKFRKPEGAFYYFLDLRHFTSDTIGWCEQLLEATGVALVPGEAFGAPGFARMTFVSDKATLSAALEKLKDYLRAN